MKVGDLLDLEIHGNFVQIPIYKEEQDMDGKRTFYAKDYQKGVYISFDASVLEGI